MLDEKGDHEIDREATGCGLEPHVRGDLSRRAANRLPPVAAAAEGLGKERLAQGDRKDVGHYNIIVMYKPGRIRSPRWREIAILCRGKALTVPAIAQAMHVEPGSIRSLIASMKRENLLEEADSEARGTALKLSRHGQAELRKHESSGGVDALLPAGERLVFVIDEGRGMPAKLLADLAADSAFRWAARIDGPVKWIASFGSGDAIAADRAANALVAAGARAVVGRSDVFVDAGGLASLASEMAGAEQQAISRRGSRSS